MKTNIIQIGERYADDSGWERSVLVDLHSGKLVIDIQGSELHAHPRDALWLIEALQKIEKKLCE